MPLHVHDPVILAKVAALVEEAIQEAEAHAGPPDELREHAAKHTHLEAQVIQAA